MDDADRLHLAESFLAEAVFASRAKQAAGAALFGASSNCGLGARAEIALELSPRAAEIARTLWPHELSAAEVERVRSVTSDWIALQDSLDRKRNHFLKDFRQRHGLDRKAYTPEQLAAFERGLAEVNSQIDDRRRQAATQLP